MMADETTAPTTVLLVDDHALFREGMREILMLEPDLQVIDEAGNGAEAIARAVQSRPAVVILDVGIPGDDAASTVTTLLARVPTTKIIILSMFDEPAVVRELLAAGASAYLLKSVTRDEVISTVRSVRAGDRLMLSISRETFEQVTGGGGGPLSGREVEIVELVARAYSNVQIARSLMITEGTVKRHLRNIFTKLGAVSRLDAVNKAVALNLVAPFQPPSPGGRS
jgi:DNA-binding NarL/FixJ family response regulator